METKVKSKLKTNRDRLDSLNDSTTSNITISDFFGTNVFNEKAMVEMMDQELVHPFIKSVQNKQAIPTPLINAYAEGLKQWAINKRVTHYTHWFQPLNGITAEKHDAFFKTVNGYSGIEKFKAADLIQKEPDASSFPNGGLRSTANARGYSVWDPTSPAFILESGGSKTLYIPAVYVSWKGDALDFKTPLLRSERALTKAASQVLDMLGKANETVTVTLGWEQEYFLIDEQLYLQRPDLVQTGRTLFGNKPARNQQFEDHYFGVIPERALQFMAEFEREAQKVGIPVVTRHNEVAPNQFECAPIFEEVNVANDHNLLLMKLMRKVAKKNGLAVLLHEKPFAGVNGNGKHNNWSLSTASGINLLEPGNDPGNNILFLTFMINVIAAIHDHEELIRASIATPGNDHRLGANEAPPAIISVFTGAYIENVLNEFKSRGLHKTTTNDALLNLGLDIIPSVKLDATDRNRTSPFPFTGNKFEYRAVGASANCAQALTVLQTAVADQLNNFIFSVNKKMEKGLDAQTAIVSTLQKLLEGTEKIIFNGNGYSEEWQAEAKKRGLSNNKRASDALSAYLSERSARLFAATGVLTPNELLARYEIAAESYVKTMELEATTMIEMAQTQVIPSVNEYFNKLTISCQSQSEVSFKFENIKNMQLNVNSNAIHKMLDHLNKMYEMTAELKSNLVTLHQIEKTQGIDEALKFAGSTIKETMAELRLAGDALELLVGAKYWNLPTYRELLLNL